MSRNVAGMPKSRGRKPQKQRKPTGHPGARASKPLVGSFSAGMLDARTRARLSGMVTGSAPSAQTLLLTMVPTLWAGMLRGQPANICVDSCRILQCCYAQFGIRSEIRALYLAVTDDAGRMYMHGTPQRDREKPWEVSYPGRRRAMQARY
jgi:hypothetical protein